MRFLPRRTKSTKKIRVGLRTPRTPPPPCPTCVLSRRVGVGRENIQPSIRGQSFVVEAKLCLWRLNFGCGGYTLTPGGLSFGCGGYTLSPGGQSFVVVAPA
eukprot:665440-Prorocentrum_minimum.AAC.1